MKFIHELVAVVNAFVVLLIMVLWAVQAIEATPGRMAQELILIPPLMIISLSLFNVPARIRSGGYLVVGIVMIPMAFAGLFGGWGIFYIFGMGAIYLYLWVELQESRPESEKRAERWKRRHFPKT